MKMGPPGTAPFSKEVDFEVKWAKVSHYFMNIRGNR
jgi:hypothetical protein